MPMYTKTGRSLWPAVVGGLCAVVIALVVALVAVARDGDQVGPTAAPTAATTAAAQTPETEDHEGQPGEDHGAELGQAPTGCLAGPGVDAEMVLTTQARAPHTAYGAVEVAASFVRWSNQYPFPNATQNATIKAEALSASGPAADWTLDKAATMKDYPELRDSYPPTNDPFGTPFTVSTRPGRWLVDPSSTDDRVTVHLSVGVVVHGALAPTTYTMGAPVLVWEGDRWRVIDMTPADAEALKAGGTTFTGGC